MKEAGINPILAANMGLSAASVGSGATASISGANAPMAQSFMGSTSASDAWSKGHSESNGSSWGSSESGLATFLTSMGEWITGLAESIGAGQKIDIAINGLEEWWKKDAKEPPTSIKNHTGAVGKYATSEAEKQVESIKGAIAKLIGR